MIPADPHESTRHPQGGDVDDLDVLLDRLADGELAVDEYRRLLASLDVQPDGWRRCALALLEAQAWRSDLPSELHSVAERPREIRQSRPRGNAARRQRVSLAMLAISVAASFLAALGIGMWLRGGFPSTPHPPHVARPSQEAPAPPSVAAPHQERQSADPRVTPTSPPHQPLPRGSLTLVVDYGSGDGEEVELPVYDLDAVDASWFENSTISQADKEALKAGGYHLLQERQLVPFELDGRKVLVPMEQVEIVPVSASYQ
ncbi:MAG: hypothetical protein RIC55_13650 [Pirellulaceae bacterium]